MVLFKGMKIKREAGELGQLPSKRDDFAHPSVSDLRLLMAEICVQETKSHPGLKAALKIGLGVAPCETYKGKMKKLKEREREGSERGFRQGEELPAALTLTLGTGEESRKLMN